MPPIQVALSFLMKEFLSSPAFLLSFSPTGKYLAVGTTQSSVILFSTDSGTPVHVLQLRHLVNAVAMLWESPYELVLACSDKRVLILHLSGDVAFLTSVDWIPYCCSGEISHIARHSTGDQTLLAIASNATVEVWAFSDYEWIFLGLFNPSSAPKDRVEGLWFLDEKRVLVHYRTAGVIVLDLSTSSTSPLELQEPYISAITYDPITQLLIVATPTKISTHATALDPSAPVPALELQGQWGTTAMGIQPAIALDNGGFVAFAPGCDVASLHIGDALSWTDSAGPTRAKGQPLRALTGDGDDVFTAAAVSRVLGKLAVGAVTYSPSTLTSNIRLWIETGGMSVNTVETKTVDAQMQTQACAITSVDDVFWRTVDARRYRLASLLRYAYKVRAAFHPSGLLNWNTFLSVITVSAFFLITSLLFRPSTPPSTIGIDLGKRVRPAPLSLLGYILRKKFGGSIKMGLRTAETTVGLFIAVIRLVVACLMEIWHGLAIVVDAFRWVVLWMMSAGLQSLLGPVEMLVAALCNEVPELSAAGLCDLR